MKSLLTDGQHEEQDQTKAAIALFAAIRSAFPGFRLDSEIAAAKIWAAAIGQYMPHAIAGLVLYAREGREYPPNLGTIVKYAQKAKEQTEAAQLQVYLNTIDEALLLEAPPGPPPALTPEEVERFAKRDQDIKELRQDLEEARRRRPEGGPEDDA